MKGGLLITLAIILLQIPSLFWVGWSFKMHQHWNPLVAAPRQCSRQAVTHFKGIPFLEHVGDDILSAGVCPLGKWAAWGLLVWTLLFITLVGVVESVKVESKKRKMIRTIAIVHAVLISLVFTGTLIANRPLWLRTLPFFFIQTAIVLILFAK